MKHTRNLDLTSNFHLSSAAGRIRVHQIYIWISMSGDPGVVCEVDILLGHHFCWWWLLSGECTVMEAAQTEARAPDRFFRRELANGRSGAYRIPVAERTYCSISLVELWWYLQSPWISTPITSTISSFLHQIGSFLPGLCLTRVRSTSVEYHWALWCKRRSEPPRLGLRDQAWTFNELSGEVEKVGGIVDTLMLQPGTSTTPALHSATKSQCVWRLRYECQRAQVLNFLVYFLQIHAIF